MAALVASKLDSLGGGGGFGGLGTDASAAGGGVGGLFNKEGGYNTDSAVSSASMPASFWAGAPHYSEGTPNTSGGIPAILHDNEAVVPLSQPWSVLPGGDEGRQPRRRRHALPHESQHERRRQGLRLVPQERRSAR